MTPQMYEARMEPDERRLLIALYATRAYAQEVMIPLDARRGGRLFVPKRTDPRWVIQDIGLDRRRAEYLLDKWTWEPEPEPWYEYGVCIDLGWLTPAGVAMAAWLFATYTPDVASS